MDMTENANSLKNEEEAGGRLMLFWVSMLALFIEIMLIRHLASEVRIFAYFKNLALIGAFLGLGFGYLYRQRVSPALTAVCIALVALATHPYAGFNLISELLDFGDFNLWSTPGATLPKIAQGIVMLAVLFGLVIVSMIPMGQVLARIFDRSDNRILDYSLNILGSIVGVWLFAYVSFERLDPVFWYIFALIGLLPLFKTDLRGIAITVVAGVLSAISLVGADRMMGEVVWSPYQQIIRNGQALTYEEDGEKKRIEIQFLMTNKMFYLYLLDLSDNYFAQHPRWFDMANRKYYYYDVPYNLPDKLDEVLILGSGGGNDVAGALRAGARHVTAVEIDPVIIDFGTRFHPEKPYSSDRVTIVNNDARNFLRTTDKKYDLIILGLVDSHTVTSSFSNTNLDSFLYTRESVGDIKKHLKEDGVMALSFYMIYDWIGAKIFRIIESEFATQPVIINYPLDWEHRYIGNGGTYFVAAKDMAKIKEKIDADPRIARKVMMSLPLKERFLEIEAQQQTDDWPYLYIKEATVPNLHLLVTVMLLIVFLVLAITMFGSPGKSDLHFMGLGAGFLLMEVAVISRFGLFWGTTWIISSIVISQILVAILVANSLYLWRGKGLPFPVIYAIIFVSLAAVYMVPLTSGWVILLYMVPFVAIGLLFAQSFDNAPVPSKALAYNLFGSLVGGLSESLSFVFGISALILVGMVFYGFSAAFVGAVHRK